MALVKFGGGVSEMRGKEAGIIYSRNAYGSYVKQKVSPVNPQTANQLEQRTLMGTLSQLWAGLSAGEKASWENLGSQVTRVNRFGDTTYYTGFSIFMKLNRNLALIGMATLDEAPVVPSIDALSFTSLTVAAGTPTMSLAFSPTVPTGFKLVIYATNNILTGRSFVKNYYRLIKVVEASQTSPQNILASWSAYFGNVLVEGAKIFIKIKLIDSTGGFEGTIATGSGTVAA